MELQTPCMTFFSCCLLCLTGLELFNLVRYLLKSKENLVERRARARHSSAFLILFFFTSWPATHLSVTPVQRIDPCVRYFRFQFNLGHLPLIIMHESLRPLWENGKQMTSDDEAESDPEKPLNWDALISGYYISWV